MQKALQELTDHPQIQFCLILMPKPPSRLTPYDNTSGKGSKGQKGKGKGSGGSWQGVRHSPSPSSDTHRLCLQDPRWQAFNFVFPVQRRRLSLRQGWSPLQAWLPPVLEMFAASILMLLAPQKGVPEEAMPILLPSQKQNAHFAEQEVSCRIQRFIQNPAEAQNQLALSSKPTREAVDSVFHLLPSSGSAPAARGAPNEDSHSFTCGAWVHGSMTGVHKNVTCFPRSIKLFCAFVRSNAPLDFYFSSFAIIQNIKADPRLDNNNLASTLNAVFPLTTFQQGGVWCESDDGPEVQFLREKEVKGRAPQSLWPFARGRLNVHFAP